LQGLSALRVLDVSGNQLRRVEVLSACRGLGLLTQLQLSGNPLQEAQNARLHVVHMLTQVGSSSP
jgi:Leucine-rich repeat (LRR) protein